MSKMPMPRHLVKVNDQKHHSFPLSSLYLSLPLSFVTCLSLLSLTRVSLPAISLFFLTMTITLLSRTVALSLPHTHSHLSPFSTPQPRSATTALFLTFLLASPFLTNSLSLIKLISIPFLTLCLTVIKSIYFLDFKMMCKYNNDLLQEVRKAKKNNFETPNNMQLRIGKE